MDFHKHTIVFFRDPGVYGLVPPAILPATVVRTYTNWTGERVIIQPAGLAPRDIPAADVITSDPEQAAFDAAREIEHRAVMENRERALQAAARLREGTRLDVSLRERRERLDANTEPARWVHAPILMCWRGE